jgi:hypothetical protein
MSRRYLGTNWTKQNKTQVVHHKTQIQLTAIQLKPNSLKWQLAFDGHLTETQSRQREKRCEPKIEAAEGVKSASNDSESDTTLLHPLLAMRKP